MVRVFTNDPDHYADPETLKSFEEELASTTLSAQQELGGIKHTEYAIIKLMKNYR